MNNNETNLSVQGQGAVPARVDFFDPQNFASAQRMSQLLASSMLVPDSYQADKIAADLMRSQHLDQATALTKAKMTSVANCMIALDIATRIGASPLMVMQNLVIIYGRPSWSSKFLIATVNSCGRFEPLKFRFTDKGKVGKFDVTDYQWNPATRQKEAVSKEFDGSKIVNMECVAWTRAKGSEDVLESSPISIRMAIEEGWYGKNGSKWKTMPQQMLMYRAASFWTSAYAPELSMGMRTVEESQDMADYTEIEDNAEQKINVSGERKVISFGPETEPVSEEERKEVPDESGEEPAGRPSPNVSESHDEDPGY